MKKYFKVTALLLSLTLVTVSVSSCYGKFALTRKIYSWNGTVSENKFVQSIVMWGLMIIPVYSIGGAVDILILNTIEFWSGNNPMAMKDGVKDTKQVTIEGTRYDITMGKNRIDIVQRSGADIGKTTTMVYVEAAQAWYMKFPDGMKKIAQVHSNNTVDFINPYEM
jgi:hypothetical protein